MNGLLIGFFFFLFYNYFYPFFQYWHIPARQQWNRQQIRREFKSLLAALVDIKPPPQPTS